MAKERRLGFLAGRKINSLQADKKNRTENTFYSARVESAKYVVIWGG
jgi:hypothetical protein